MDETKQMEAAREAALTKAQAETYSAWTVNERVMFRIGFEAGYESGKADGWVKITGPESLPKKMGIFWVTLTSGRVTKSAFYVGAFELDVIAWMPDEPPAPYQEDK